MHKPIQTDLFDTSPLPTVIVEHSEDTLNHALIYQNKSFSDSIGWSLAEIPDKNTWWITAYPDPKYQKVVESLWEVSMESLDDDDNNSVTIDVNIMTKHQGIKRFKVCTEVKSTYLDGYYVVTFEESTNPDKHEY